MPFKPYLEKTVELILEFRDLKRKWMITSAGFHHLITSYQEDCDFFLLWIKALA